MKRKKSGMAKMLPFLLACCRSHHAIRGWNHCCRALICILGKSTVVKIGVNGMSLVGGWADASKVEDIELEMLGIGYALYMGIRLHPSIEQT